MRRAAALVALLPTFVVASSAAALTPIPVLTTTANELQPEAAPGYLAWTQAPKAHPTRYNAFARREGGPRLRLNARGTVGFSGAIDGRRAVFTQRRSFTAPGDLKFFDLATRRRSNPPAGVNTRDHEKGGSLAGDWLLFTRVSESSDRVILFNLATGEARQLDFARGGAYAQQGGVRGNYAAWIKCPRLTRCNAYVYDIGARAKVRVPNPSRRSQYAVSVTAAGVVYFAESRSINCGRRLALWRYPLGGRRTKLLSFARGRDVSTVSPLVNPDGSTILFFDRFRCRTGRADIFKLVIAP